MLIYALEDNYGHFEIIGYPNRHIQLLIWSPCAGAILSLWLILKIWWLLIDVREQLIFHLGSPSCSHWPQIPTKLPSLLPSRTSLLAGACPLIGNLPWFYLCRTGLCIVEPEHSFMNIETVARSQQLCNLYGECILPFHIDKNSLVVG